MSARRIDITHQLLETFSHRVEPGRGEPPVTKIFLTVEGGDGGEGDATAERELALDLERALQHERLLLAISERSRVSPEEWLGFILGQIDRGPQLSERASTLSEPELEALQGANVDLSGPSSRHPAPEGLATSRYAVMLAGALTVNEVSQRLDVTSGRIRQRISARTLYALRSQGEWRLPAWQFDGDGVVPGLEDVLPALPELHPLSVLGFLSRHDPDLEIDGETVSPLTWLASGGDPRPVAELASALPAAP